MRNKGLLFLAALSLSIFFPPGRTYAQQGRLAPPENWAAISGMTSQAAGDLNGDGKSELLVAQDSAEPVKYRILEGDGTSSSRATSLQGDLPRIAATDFDGDGRADVVVTARSRDSGSNTYLGLWEVHLASGKILKGTEVEDSPDGLAALKTGFVYSNWGGPFDGSISVHTFRGGQFSRESLPGIKNAGNNRILVADLNGDGVEDVIVMWGQGLSPIFSVYHGLPEGGFQKRVDYPRDELNDDPTAFAAGDWNGDGLEELAVASRKGLTPILRIYFQKPGEPGLFLGEEKELPDWVDGMVFADINCDYQQKELLLTSPPKGTSFYWYESGGSRRPFQEESGQRSNHLGTKKGLLAFDMMGDERPEIAVMGLEGPVILEQNPCSGGQSLPTAVPPQGDAGVYRAVKVYLPLTSQRF